MLDCSAVIALPQQAGSGEHTCKRMSDGVKRRQAAGGLQRQSPLDGQSDEQIEAQALADLAQRSQRQRRNRPESDVPVNDEIVYATAMSFHAHKLSCERCAVVSISCIGIL